MTSGHAEWRRILFPLTLGTAQLGMAYGKVVHVMPPDQAQVHGLFDAAAEAGINCFDTARIYQDAESHIGAWLEGGSARPAVVSKVHPFPDMPDEAIRRYLDDNYSATRQNLGLARLDGYLIHSARDLAKPGVADFLASLKATGGVRATGLSVYEPGQIMAALDHAADVVDLVQSPMSLFDRRLVESGAADRCIARGVTLFARSVFLQGVLFLPPDRLPDFLAPLAEPLRGLRHLATESNRSLTALAIASALSGTPVASVVIGVGDVAQLEAAVDAVRRPVAAEVVAAARALCTGVPERLLDPRQWPAREEASA